MPAKWGTMMKECLLLLSLLWGTVNAIGCVPGVLFTINDRPEITSPQTKQICKDGNPVDDCPVPYFCFNATGSGGNVTGSPQNGNTISLDKFNDIKDFQEVNIVCKSNTDKKNCKIFLDYNYFNSYPPVFNSTSYTVNIKESEPTDYILFNIFAHLTDKDKWRAPLKHKYEYSLVVQSPVDGAGTFEATSDGNVILKKSLDYDKMSKTYVVNITCKDVSDSINFEYASVLLTVNVKNIDDQPVKFEKEIYSAEVKENVATGEIPITPRPVAINMEFGNNDSIIYEILDPSPSSFADYFDFDSSSMTLSIKKPLLRSTVTRFTAKLKAFRENKTFSSDVSYLLVTVLKGNNHPPQITNTPTSVDISELLKQGSAVTIVHAEDQDGDQVEYHFKSQSYPIFKVDKESGLITITQDIKDPSKFPVKLTVYATESNTSKARNSSAHLITVNLIDENTHNPVFEKTQYEYNIPLTTTINQVVATITAIDSDSLKTHSDVKFKMLTTSVPFKQDPDGKLSVSGLLEVKVYNFAVIAFDSDPSQPRSSAIMVTVNVTSVNRPPQFSGSILRNINVYETTAPGSILTSIGATDPDGDSLNYSVSSSGDYFNTRPSVDPTVWLLTLKKWLNETSSQSIEAQLTVTDGNQSDNRTINISVILTNNYPPVFTQVEYQFSILENATIDTSVGQVKAEDKDQNDEVEYSLLNNQNFKIDSKQGIILTNQIFTRPATYHFVVEAYDRNKQHTAVALVIVDVKDINNKRPMFVKSLVEIQIAEDQICADLYTPTATDEDDDKDYKQITFSTDDSNFEITSNVLRLKHSPTCPQSYLNLLDTTVNVRIKASDKQDASLFSYMTLSIYFQDINNNIPEFDIATLDLLPVNESTPVGTSLYRFSVTDKDATSVNQASKFSIKDQNPDEDKIRIDPLSGILYLNKPLDYDDPTSDRNITFKVVVENIVENAASVKTNQSTVSVTVVTIDDADDIPLTMDKNVYVEYVAESHSVNTAVFTVAASKSAQYSILNNTVPFALASPSSGQLMLTRQLDYNQNNTYIFTVQATHNTEISYAVVAVKVTNVNDAPTIEGPFQFTIPENLPRNSYVGHIFATDPDYDTLDYQLTDPNFSVNSTTGDVYTLRKFDYESTTTKQLSFTVTVSDTGNLKDIRGFTVTIYNTNDTEPQFNGSLFTAQISESSSVNTVVTMVQATNADQMGPVMYSLYGDNQYFNITDQGLVTVRSSLQEKTVLDKFLSLMIVANNGKYKNAALLVVEIVRPFQFIKDHYDVYVQQNASTATRVFQLSPFSMVDPSVDLSTMSVNLSDDTFVYNKSCMCVVVNKMLTNLTYDVTLTVTQNTNTSSTQLIVHVLPVNLDPPQILLKSDTVDVPDNVLPGYVVSGIEAKDENSLIQGFTFYLTETFNKFHVNPSGGNLTVSNELDYKLQSQYNLTIFVQDHGSPPLQSQKSLLVNVINSNKASPNITNLPDSISIKENSNSGSIFVVTATDADNDNVTYAIEQGDEDKIFEIDPVSGIIGVKKPTALDFEKTKTFQLLIKATDSARNPLSDSKLLSIVLTDQNDNTPRFWSQHYFTKNLPIAANEEVFQIHADDGDSSLNNNNVITFSILNTPSMFSINSSTGVVKSTTKLTKPELYMIEIQACDGGPLCTNSTFEFLTSSDVPLVAHVKENVSDAFVLNLTSSVNGITYYLKTCTNLFTIDNQAGVLKTKASLKWGPSQSSQDLIVVEERPSSNSSEIKIKVFIEDINDHQPVFEHSEYEWSVLENSVAMFNVTATDSDSQLNANITYSLTSQPALKAGSVAVDVLTGVLTVTNLDREEMSNITFNVVANDNGNPALQSTATVTIKITDTNDNPPVFSSKPSVVSVDENSPNTLVTTVKATDQDIGANGAVFYSLIDPSLPFTINPITGQLYTSGSLDYESQAKYDIEILASDMGEVQLNSTFNVTVNVNDICDNKLQLTPTVFVADNFARYRPMLSFSSQGSGVSFSLVDSGNIFSINGSSGDLSISSTFPSQPRRYNVTVKAQNMCNVSVNEEVTIILEESSKNHHRPVFETSVYEWSVLENSVAMFNVTATDSDSQLNTNITYSLTSQPALKAGSVAVDVLTGVLTVTNLDREEMSNITFNVVANDNGNPALQSTATVTIKITDTNDNPPVFSSKPSVVSVDENSPNTLVTTVKATDQDIGANGAVFYSLIDPSLPFTINAMTGQLYTSGSLDYESQAKYDIEILASDMGEVQLNSTFNVTVNVNDICDNKLQLTPSVFVADNFARYRPMLSFSSQGSGVSFSLVDRGNIFSINGSSGDLSISSTFPSQPRRYNVTVKAQNMCNVSVNEEVTIILEESSKNHHRPVFETSVYEWSVLENSVAMFNVTATDSDSQLNTNITYSLTSQPALKAGSVAVDLLTGVLTVTNLDREEISNITFNVVANDNGNPALQSTATVTIKITDTNDNPPVFSSKPSVVSVDENSPNTLVTTVKATDQDIGANGAIFYSLIDPSLPFTINAMTGQLYTSGSLDYESQAKYDIEILASDMGEVQLNSTFNVTVNVNDICDNKLQLTPTVFVADNFARYRPMLSFSSQGSGVNFSLVDSGNIFSINGSSGDLSISSTFPSQPRRYNVTVKAQNMCNVSVNEEVTIILEESSKNHHRPVFETSVYEWSVLENSVAMFNVTATDSDSQLNTNITYSLTSQPALKAGSVAVDVLTGVLTVTNLDREEMSNVTFNVVANDNGNPALQSTATVTIKITDTNDNPPVFSSKPSVVSVDENSPNTLVTTVKATDQDIGANGAIFYSLIDPSLPFTINAMTGQLYTSDSLDYESQAKYDIEILASDMGEVQLNSTFNVTVNVNDICDNKLQLTPTVFVADNFARYRPMLSFSSQGSGVNFSLVDSGNIFSINGSSGDLSISSTFPSQPRRYNVTVKAQNMCNVSVNEEVTIILEESSKNHHRPVFETSVYEWRVLENSVAMFNVTATDSDSQLNTNITYSLTSQPGLKAGSVAVDVLTGVLTVTNLDREEMSNVTFNVVANDNGNPALQSTATVTIKITDTNDNPPVFSSKPSVVSVDENSPNTLVTTVKATDQDIGANGAVFYSLIDPSLPFTINAMTGQLYTSGSLDYESQAKYDIEILASDMGEVQLNSTFNVTVNVNDICDNKLQLTPTVFVADNFAIDRPMLSFSSQGSGVNFSLVDSGNIFSINGSSGDLSISSTFPSQPRRYNVTVKAQNMCNVSMNEEVTIEVFKAASSNVLRIEIEEEVVNNQSIFNFTSLKDLQGKGFKVQNYQDFFFIQDEQLMLQKALDREVNSQIILRILVTAKPTNRVKRSASNSNGSGGGDTILEIEINVKDSNDNGPEFPSDVLYFGIPIKSSPYFEVGKALAVDKDVGENSISIYSLTGPDKNKFFINPLTASLHTLFQAAVVEQKEYKVTVIAVDKVDPLKNDSVQVMMSIFSDDSSMILTVNATVDRVRAKREILIRNLSNSLGVHIIVDHIQVHVDQNQPDINRTDILFHAVDKDKKLVSKKDLQKKFKDKEDEIKEILKSLHMDMDSLKEVEKDGNGPVVERVKHDRDSSLIIIIILAIIILITSIATIILFVVISKRYKKKFDGLQTTLFSQSEADNQAFESEELGMTRFDRNSHSSSSGHVSGGSELSLYNSIPYRPQGQELEDSEQGGGGEGQGAAAAAADEVPHLTLSMEMAQGETNTDELIGNDVPESSDDVQNEDQDYPSQYLTLSSPTPTTALDDVVNSPDYPQDKDFPDEHPQTGASIPVTPPPTHKVVLESPDYPKDSLEDSSEDSPDYPKDPVPAAPAPGDTQAYNDDMPDPSENVYCDILNTSKTVTFKENNDDDDDDDPDMSTDL